MVETLFVGVDAWIIQDGNYGDFEVGETEKFALEIYPHSFSHASSPGKLAERLTANDYRVRGQIVYAQEEAWVIDFGVLAYQKSRLPAEIVSGAWVEGQMYVGIDPFFYVEDLCNLPGMPPLQYDWRIQGISIETTPWLQTRNEIGQIVRTRDQGRRSFETVNATDAWKDDGGSAHYVLECVRIGAVER